MNKPKSKPPESTPSPAANVPLRSRQATRTKEWFIMAGLVACAAFSVIITTTIVVVLIAETSHFFVQGAEEWKHKAPEQIEASAAAVERAKSTLVEKELALDELSSQDEDSGDEESGTIEEQRARLQRELKEARVQLDYSNETHDRWKWKEENASVSGVFRQFFGSTKWSPQYTQDYGIWPLISGTFMVAFIAMLVALPLGLVTAIYLSEYAPRRVRSILKPTLEILAGIPTVVYGYFALRIITPGLIAIHDGVNGFNSLSGGIMVGVLCLPIVTSMAEDALQAVPRSLRDAAYGLGSTRFDVSMKVVVPAALSGIISAFLLAIARAVGETMIVALAAGSTPNLTLDPTQEIQTMTGYMVQIMGGDAPHGTPEYASLYAVAAVLFVMTLSLTIIGNMVRRRFREAYQ